MIWLSLLIAHFENNFSIFPWTVEIYKNDVMKYQGVSDSLYNSHFWTSEFYLTDYFWDRSVVDTSDANNKYYVFSFPGQDQ